LGLLQHNLPLADTGVWRDHARHGPVMEGGAA
jgi:hypothetical protein